MTISIADKTYKVFTRPDALPLTNSFVFSYYKYLTYINYFILLSIICMYFLCRRSFRYMLLQ